jgi:hypothetical protein
MRRVIFHYHFFKNAGTSVDAILRRNFGARWLQQEFAHGVNHEAAAAWIAAAPEAVAFSSHTANFPLPVLPDTQVYPIVFLRHPLDRIRSAYLFERRQQSDSYGAVLAKQTDIAGYVRTRLSSLHDYQCRNFQTVRMARLIQGNRRDEMDRALEALRTLPFVGLVEDFDGSTARLGAWLKAAFPEFKAFAVHRNITAGERLSLPERMGQLRDELGPALYAELVDANLKDISLHAAATARAEILAG